MRNILSENKLLAFITKDELKDELKLFSLSNRSF